MSSLFLHCLSRKQRKMQKVNLFNNPDPSMVNTPTIINQSQTSIIQLDLVLRKTKSTIKTQKYNNNKHEIHQLIEILIKILNKTKTNKSTNIYKQSSDLVIPEPKTETKHWKNKIQIQTFETKLTEFQNWPDLTTSNKTSIYQSTVSLPPVTILTTRSEATGFLCTSLCFYETETSLDSKRKL